MISIVHRFNGNNYNFNSIYCEVPMKWKHAVRNIQDVKLASKNKYCGIEIDINLHPNGVLISEYHNPMNLVAPKVVDLMRAAPEIEYWWLDFKNLKYSNATLASSVLKKLEAATDGKIIVESKNFFGLFFLNVDSSDIFKAYWLAKNSKLYLYFPYLARSILAMIMIDPDFVTLFSNQVSNNDYIWIGSRQKLVFTVNDPSDFNDLVLKDVEVVLTDTLPP